MKTSSEIIAQCQRIIEKSRQRQNPHGGANQKELRDGKRRVFVINILEKIQTGARKPATEKHWQLRRKLEALAARGVDGERSAAATKLARLESKVDFSAPEPNAPNLFDGHFEPSASARFLCRFTATESHLGNFAKWAIEHGAKINATWRGAGFDSELWVEASEATLPALNQISEVVRRNFSELWEKFAAASGAHERERSNFMLGLYDGMMSDELPAGARLPSTPIPKRSAKGKRGAKKAVAIAPGVALHAYSVALAFGRKIRLLTPLGEITAQLETTIKSLAA